jgi:hypothetical protein
MAQALKSPVMGLYIRENFKRASNLGKGLKYCKDKFFIIIYSKDGRKREGKWNKGKLEGEAVLTMPSGEVYIEKYEEGVKKGEKMKTGTCAIF